MASPASYPTNFPRFSSNDKQEKLDSDRSDWRSAAFDGSATNGNLLVGQR